jgi:alpha-galactosidase
MGPVDGDLLRLCKKYKSERHRVAVFLSPKRFPFEVDRREEKIMQTNNPPQNPRVASREGRMESELRNRRGTSCGRFRSLSRWLALALFVFGLLANRVQAAGPDTSRDVENDEWLQSHLGIGSRLPFSFVYGRQSSRELLGKCQKKTQSQALDDNRTEHVVIWTDPKTQLQIRLRGLSYASSPVIEWTLFFKNGGNADTPILEEVQALDMSVPVGGNGIPTLLYSRGAGGMDAYSLQKRRLNQLEDFRMSNDGGGKTAETIPFFDIRMDGRGLIGAVGWLGQWVISFSRPTQAAIELKAGMQYTHLSLHPGEEIRTPRILLLFWEEDRVRAHNMWRRLILAHYTPRPNGQLLQPPFCEGAWGAQTEADRKSVG